MKKYLNSILVVVITVTTLVLMAGIKPQAAPAEVQNTMIRDTILEHPLIKSQGEVPDAQNQKAYSNEEDDFGRFLFEY